MGPIARPHTHSTNDTQSLKPKVHHATTLKRKLEFKGYSKELLNCKLCKKSFTKLLALKLHVRAKIHEDSLKCGICGEASESVKEVKEHLLNTHNLKRLKNKKQLLKIHNSTKLVKTKNSHSCKLCNKMLSSSQSLEDHIARHLGEKHHVCKYCSKSYANAHALENHARTHGEKTFKCKFCPYASHWPLALTRHVASWHKDAKKSVKYFEKKIVFDTMENLLQNLETKEKDGFTYSIKKHNQVRKNHCELCPKQCEWKSSLQRHMHPSYKDHQEIKHLKKTKVPEGFKWNFFLKMYTREKYLKLIIENNHEGVENLQKMKKLQYRRRVSASDTEAKRKSYRKTIAKPICKICGKLFKKVSEVFEHMVVHTREKPFKCKICERSFGHIQSLKLHWRTHTKERDFKCTQCGNGFRRSETLRRHVKSVHSNEKSFECSLCDKSFNRKDVLLEHLRKHTGKGGISNRL